MVIDVQNDVVANAVRSDQVVANINNLITQARAARIPVIWVQHSDDYLEVGSDGWQFVAELKPLEGDVRIYKTHPSSFDETELAKELERFHTKSLVITGAQTDYCINATTNDAAARGFEVTLVSDAHTTENSEAAAAEDIIQAKNHSFAALGRVVSTAQVVF